MARQAAALLTTRDREHICLGRARLYFPVQVREFERLGCCWSLRKPFFGRYAIALTRRASSSVSEESCSKWGRESIGLRNSFESMARSNRIGLMEGTLRLMPRAVSRSAMVPRDQT